MPPKPAKPVYDPHDLQQQHDNAVKLETTVNGLLHHGDLGKAKRVFDQDWQDAMLADLPLRVAFLLEQPDRKGIHKLMDLVEDGQEFQLQLEHGINPRNKSAVAIGIVGHEAIIGWLPADALEILRETGLKVDPERAEFKNLPKDPREKVVALAGQLELGKSDVAKMAQEEFGIALADLSNHQLRALVELLQEMVLAVHAGVFVEFKRLLGGGTYAAVYEPKILAIRGMQAGKVEFEMELVRPDFRHCIACERIHVGDDDKCGDCLAENRRKRPKKEAVPEVPAVPVAQAFHNITEAEQNKQDD